MDKRYLKTLIESLKSTSSSRVQESLIKIRNEVTATENDIKLFSECGGLTYLIPHLRKPNERILDLTLSILGNFCLNSECRLEVGKLNIVAPLITVLKTVCRDSIVGRACRVVGNLSQNTSIAEDLHNHGVVSALVTLIESRDKNTSYPTLTMAVRALRQLWMVADKREEMLKTNCVRCIAILLTTECELVGILKSDNPQNESMEMRKSQEELISGILKCLGYFAMHITAQCATQIQGDGRGFQCLIALTKKFESLAMRCLMNLCNLSDCRQLLGTAGLVPCIAGILQKISDVSCWPEGAAWILAQMSSESVNRARIRQCGGLPLLIVAAREHTFALRALLQYMFDDLSFHILVNEGIIGLITDELKKHLLTMDCEHNYKQNKQESNNETTLMLSKLSEAPNDDKTAEFAGLFKRRKRLLKSKKDGLNVVIERDNMFIGFNENIDSDTSDSQNDEDARKFLKRARSKSPTAFMKRSQKWGSSIYWEMSPKSDGTAGFSPECPSSSKRSCWDWSPESGFSTGEGSTTSPYWTDYQWSPSSSGGPTSPFSIATEVSSDSEVSGRYSPVCSEHEEVATTVGGGAALALDAAQAALDELAMDDADAPYADDEPLTEMEKEPQMDIHSSRVACALVLLYRMVNGSCDNKYEPTMAPNMPNNNLEPLTDKECLNALLDYVMKCRNPMGRAGHILTLIFGFWPCLLNLLKHKIVIKIYKMSTEIKHPIYKCRQCRLLKKLYIRLTNQMKQGAESRYGIGEISYQLLRGPEPMKKTLSLTLPLIVKSKEVLRKFYIECDALVMLLKEVPDSTEEFEVYLTALEMLSVNVRIKDPKDLECRFSDQVCLRYDPLLDGLTKNEIVTFELDDLSTVKANKTFLCQNSEVFNAMLMGCFKESTEESVRLKNVTKPGLEYLLTLLHCGLNNFNCDVKVFPTADKLETNLEVLLLADRFLLDKVKVLLHSAILQFMMLPNTADKIYVWSLREGMGFLCVESVAYLLTGKMCELDRSRAFKNILSLEYKEQWLDDIRAIILRQLEDWP